MNVEERAYCMADKSDFYTARRIACHNQVGITEPFLQGNKIAPANYEAHTYRIKGITIMGAAFIAAGLRTEKQATVEQLAYKNMARP